jgi:aminomethyltransferase
MPETLLHTPLHDRHVELGARMVPFAGWEMPVQYAGVSEEHRAVRRDAGVFDVSHMGELEVEGPRAQELLQGALSNDLDRLTPGEAQYTLLTNEDGGIIDDLIVYRVGEHSYLLVVNASNRAIAYSWLKDREIPGSDVRDVSDDCALLAVQGPRAIERLGLPGPPAFTFAEASLDGIEVVVNRTGYTGEDGVRAAVHERGRRAALGLRARAGCRPVWSRRAGHAAPRGLLPAARQRHRAGHRRDLRRPRLGRAGSERSSRESRSCDGSSWRALSVGSSPSSWRSGQSRGQECRSRAAAR